MNNTGYKLASKVKVTRKAKGVTSDNYYSLGKYVDDNFVFMTPGELSVLSDAEYASCLTDTKRYIALKENIPDINNIFINEAKVEDLYMCPLPLTENPITALAFKTPANEVGITFTSKYKVASDVTILLKYGNISNSYILKTGTSDLSVIAGEEYWGKTCLLSVYIGNSGIRNDNQYIYTIQESIGIPDIFIDLTDNTPVITFEEKEGKIVVNIDFPRPTEDDVRMDVKYVGGGKTLIIKAGTTHRDFILDASKGGYFLIIKTEKAGGNVNAPVTNPEVVNGYVYGTQYKYRYETYNGILPTITIKDNPITANSGVVSGQAYIQFTSQYPLRSTIGIQVETTDGNFSQNITLAPNSTVQKENIGYFFKGKEVRLSIIYIYDGTTGNNTSADSDNVYKYSVTPLLNIPEA